MKGVPQKKIGAGAENSSGAAPPWRGRQAGVVRASRGDTIVEVLIATAIIGAVLSGAYAFSTRSLRAGRIAQERTEAVKLVEGQLEKLKSKARSDTQFDTNFRINDYCLTTGPGGTVTQNLNTPSINASCINGLYTLNITYSPVDHSVPEKFIGTFSARASWERIGGGQDEVTLEYQL